MDLSQIITDEIVKGSAGGTYDDLEAPIVKQGYYFLTTHVSVENRTTGYTRLVIGVADGNSFYQKEEEDSPAANNLYWSRSKLLVPAGKRLRVRLTGCTSGDELHLTYEGYLIKGDGHA